jgi:hypothetical protein
MAQQSSQSYSKRWLRQAAGGRLLVSGAVTVVVLTDSLLIDPAQSASIEDATAMANATIAALQQEVATTRPHRRRRRAEIAVVSVPKRPCGRK